MLHNSATTRMAVVGLGYVGLPLAVGFAQKIDVVGYDINEGRVSELSAGNDSNLEVSDQELRDSTRLSFTSSADDLRDCNVYVVTTPTPVDRHKVPDLLPILAASAAIGPTLNRGDVVIFESTVYPGATEDECSPILESTSGLTLNQDFYLGYSPERINPGDAEHRFTTIMKVTSGSTPEAAEFVDQLYQLVVEAGTHRAPSIRVAEAAKVIENIQRDVNIALINELSMLFNKLGIDNRAVLEAAGTKWNFLKFRPGLVGGHCIGIDPYYLTHKAKEIDYHPEMILAGRRINDSMGPYVASELIKAMTKTRTVVCGSRVLVLGLTFKENTPDLRNTRVVDITKELTEYGAEVIVHDPWCDPAEARAHLNVEVEETPGAGEYDAVVLAVAHREFLEQGSTWVRSFVKPGGIVYDLKQVLPAGDADLSL
ncbi:Vi polysaccharide biosynthesis protein VipA/TviB [Brachybacterium vulturis]|uniref:Vi polysaccharide biosynthesis protein VipA/TviB n=1 Tax=Brachybacterium vulturis TaxID=2017484 RepID=A0A291GK00_9MICO|nr:nucleotide sugar dehydrogenase [Brachybacterium vulturis]ATG50304.1 Vi polysaccharide biosynthesis protein VipA/TviB [Brachybacterium vulturis]